MPNSYLTDQDRKIVQETIDEVANRPGGRTLGRNQRPRNLSGGFAFSGFDFETLQKDDTTITVKPGNIIGGYDETATTEQDVTIDTGTDGTHYVYIEIYWQSLIVTGSWVYSYGVSVNARPGQNEGALPPVYRKVLCKVTVDGNVIALVSPNHVGEIDLPRVS